MDHCEEQEQNQQKPAGFHSLTLCHVLWYLQQRAGQAGDCSNDIPGAGLCSAWLLVGLLHIFCLRNEIHCAGAGSLGRELLDNRQYKHCSAFQSLVLPLSPCLSNSSAQAAVNVKNLLHKVNYYHHQYFLLFRETHRSGLPKESGLAMAFTEW